MQQGPCGSKDPGNSKGPGGAAAASRTHFGGRSHQAPTPPAIGSPPNARLDDEPVQIAITYIPWTTAQGSVLATDAHTGTGSIYARLAELGHDIMQAREEITARMPRPDEIAVLAIPVGVPVIEVLHTGIDQNSQPFEVTRFVMRADVAALDYRLPVED
jgi:GntR family transcriptional regulator